MRLAELGTGAGRVLAAFVAQLEAQQHPLPEMRFAVAGTAPVFDGEQLNVAMWKLGRGQPERPDVSTGYPGGSPFWVQWAISLVRLAPTIEEGAEVPTVPEDQLTASAEQAISDAAALLQAAIAIQVQSVSTTPAGHPNPFAITGSGEGFIIGEVVPLGPEGGVVANRLIISHSLH